MGTVEPRHSVAMTPDEKAFFRKLGARMAELRRDQGLTQVQLGELVGVSQQQIASFEIGRRRVPVSLLAAVAAVLAVTVEELIGGPGGRPYGKRGPAAKPQQQLERSSELPKAKQRMVSEVLDSLLAQAGRWPLRSQPQQQQ